MIVALLHRISSFDPASTSVFFFCLHYLSFVHLDHPKCCFSPLLLLHFCTSNIPNNYKLLLIFAHCTEAAKHRSSDVVKQLAATHTLAISRGPQAAFIAFHTVSTNLLLSWIRTFPCINLRRMGTTKKALPSSCKFLRH